MRHVGSRRPCIMYEGKWWIAAPVLASFFIEGDLTPVGAWLAAAVTSDLYLFTAAG